MSYLKLLYRRRTRLTYWIEEVKKTLSPVTAHSYNGLIKHLLLYEERWGIKDPRLSHIGLNYCQGFARYLAQADNARTQIPRPLSINTQKKLLIQLETILNKAVRSGLLPSNPCSELDFSFKKRCPNGIISRMKKSKGCNIPAVGMKSLKTHFYSVVSVASGGVTLNL